VRYSALQVVMTLLAHVAVLPRVRTQRKLSVRTDHRPVDHSEQR